MIEEDIPYRSGRILQALLKGLPIKVGDNTYSLTDRNHLAVKNDDTLVSYECGLDQFIHLCNKVTPQEFAVICQSMEVENLENINKAVLEVLHSKLPSVNGDSLYRKKCIVCNMGTLFVQRDFETLQIGEYDMCVICGQQYRYLDIEDLRKLEEPTDLGNYLF